MVIHTWSVIFHENRFEGSFHPGLAEIFASDGVTGIESFVCPNDTFKCPGLYCVKLRYVCDGLWDCPSGHEENNCTSSSPGLYKCKDTQIHVALENICDNFTDCPFSDDQMLCDIRYVTCPERTAHMSRENCFGVHFCTHHHVCKQHTHPFHHL